MDKSQEFTATLHGASRHGLSANGNPTWVLHTSEGDYRTQTDAALGYEVSNHAGGTDTWIGKRVKFTATPTGRVYAWELVQS